MSGNPGANGSDDTQREHEKRALRGVRHLVDTLDGMEQVDRRKQRRLFGMIVVGALIGVAMLAGAVIFISNKSSSNGPAIVIVPVKK